MKSFDDFEKYIKTDGKSVHDEIVSTVNALAEKANFKDNSEEYFFKQQAFAEMSVMKILRHYHEWLNNN